MWGIQLQRIPWCQTEGDACCMYYRFVFKGIFRITVEHILYVILHYLPVISYSMWQLFLSQNQPTSDDKARKLKKKVSAKRKSQLEVTKEREDDCFFCGDGGQIVSCKKPGCPKVYHADCLNLSKRPAGELLIFKQHGSLGSPFLPCVDEFWKGKKKIKNRWKPLVYSTVHMSGVDKVFFIIIIMFLKSLVLTKAGFIW